MAKLRDFRLRSGHGERLACHRSAILNRRIVPEFQHSRCDSIPAYKKTKLTQYRGGLARGQLSRKAPISREILSIGRNYTIPANLKQNTANIKCRNLPVYPLQFAILEI